MAGARAHSRAPLYSAGAPWRHGAVPFRGHQIRQTSANDMNYGGGISGVGVTTGPERVYVVFWGSQWGTQSTNSAGNFTYSGDPQGFAPDLQAFMKGLGTGGETWSGVMTQYCQGIATGAQTCPASNTQHVGYPTGGALAGVWEDTSTAAPSAATAHQLAQEAENAATHFGNTTTTSNRNDQYVIVSPTGTDPDSYQTQGFCAWHDYSGDTTMDGGGAVSGPTLAFTNLPYLTDAGSSCGQNFVNSGSAGTLDGVTIVEGHEYAETVTDQFPAGGWTGSSGAENGDKCAWISSGQGASQNITLTTGTFAVQSTWANDFNSGAGGCEVSHPIVTNPGNTVSVTNPGNQTSTVGTSVSLQIQASDSASGQTLTYSATGLPAGLSINSSSGLISGTPTTAATSSVTVTATDTTGAAGSASFTWTVNPAGGNTVTVTNPGNQSSTVGTAVSLQIHATDSASGQTLTYSATGLPVGLSISGSSGLISGTPTTAGTSSVTVKATDTTGAAGSASFTWTVSSSSGGGITNGGFETGSLSGWTASGAAHSVTTSGCHSGTYCALLGSSSPTNGDSSIAQTFTVPSGSGSLSFYYNVTCPDTVTYDWATATLKNNTTGTTSTVLAKTCVASSGWKQVTATVVAGDSYTLTLTSHDDNYSGDPTYTKYDDVTLGAAPPAGITNGGFETGSLSGWTASGAAHSVTTSGCHSGAYCALLGSSSATNGDSSIAQTFLVPSGSSTLHFFYNVTCPDTVTYDWATATLKNNTTGTTTTVLGKTCVASSGWVQVNASVVAGDSYTLTLTSHDDNYPGDPTYTKYDDVTLS
ncbi:MAG TPA: putative Ig domain-containing protein [Solirubrobacteraceae bacterium]|nr:putative Ig domain-containing protein [Solirubrobacteraceae bacterium]